MISRVFSYTYNIYGEKAVSEAVCRWVNIVIVMTWHDMSWHEILRLEIRIEYWLNHWYSKWEVEEYLCSFLRIVMQNNYCIYSVSPQIICGFLFYVTKVNLEKLNCRALRTSLTNTHTDIYMFYSIWSSHLCRRLETYVLSNFFLLLCLPCLSLSTSLDSALSLFLT